MFVYMNVYMHVCMHVMYTCVHVCIYIYIYIYIYICMYICMYVYMHVCMYVCMYVCILHIRLCMHACMYMCVCMYVCIYVCIHIYIYIYICMYVCARIYKVQYYIFKHISRKTWAPNPRLRICGRVMIMSLNSGLAQDLFVLVDKTCMVAERLLDLRLPRFPPIAIAARSTMSGAEEFIRSFADNRAAQIAIGEWVDTASNLGAIVMTLKVAFYVGGRAVNMISDRAKRMWIKENFDALVETYDMASSASLRDTPMGIPDEAIKSKEFGWPVKLCA